MYPLSWRRAVKMGRLVLILAAAVLVCAHAFPAEGDRLKSGPQAGDNLPGPFYPLVAHSGEPGVVGKRIDFSEKYGQSPVVLVFAREITNPLTTLVKKLDAEVAKRKSAKLRAIVVILSDDYALETSLKDYGKKKAIKHVNLAIMEPDSARPYKVSKEADVTVVMYKRRKVEANHAFKKGELNENAVRRILADVPKVTSQRGDGPDKARAERLGSDMDRES
jgi:hypothetical protein